MRASRTSLISVFVLFAVFGTLSAYSVDPPGQNCTECSYDCLKKVDRDYACNVIAKQYCGGFWSRFNFFDVLYCSLDEQLWAFVIIAIIIILLVFRFISATVDEYISDGITVMSDFLGLSESMAAVTLLALANGAGDVITALVASGTEGGISYNVGALFGAGFFVCSFQIALTIFKSPKNAVIVVDKSTIFRDVAFYILATVVTLIFAATGKIYWWSALIMLLIYVSMVVVVYIQDRLEPKQSEVGSGQESQKMLLDDMHNAERPLNHTNMGSEGTQNDSEALQKFRNAGKKVMAQVAAVEALKEARLSRQEQKKLSRVSGIGAASFKESLKNSHAVAKLHDTVKSSEKGDGLPDEEEEDDDKPWAEMSTYERIDFVIDFPFGWIRRVTMPPSSKENYDKTLCILWPFTGMILILYCFEQLSSEAARLAGAGVAIVLSCIFYYTQKDLPEGQAPRYFPLIATLSTFAGLLWTYILSEMLIDLLNVFSVRLNLDQTFMGLTVIGIGNALPDGLTAIALATKGFAQMGITGAYAGQLFGLLVGFGLAQLKETIKNGTASPFDLFQNPKANLLDIMVIAIALFNLFVTAVYSIINKYHYNRQLGWILMGIYVAFLLAALSVQIWYIVDNVNVQPSS